MTGDFRAADARARMDEWKARADRLMHDTQAMAEKMQRLKVTATNADNNIRVAVNSAGVVEDLRLKESAKELSAEDLAAEILKTMRKAQQQLSKGAEQVVKDTIGVESESGKAVLAGYQRMNSYTNPSGEEGQRS